MDFAPPNAGSRLIAVLSKRLKRVPPAQKAGKLQGTVLLKVGRLRAWGKVEQHVLHSAEKSDTSRRSEVSWGLSLTKPSQHGYGLLRRTTTQVLASTNKEPISPPAANGGTTGVCPTGDTLGMTHWRHSAKEESPYVVPIRGTVTERHSQDKPGYEVDDSHADNKKDDVHFPVPDPFVRRPLTAARPIAGYASVLTRSKNSTYLFRSSGFFRASIADRG